MKEKFLILFIFIISSFTTTKAQSSFFSEPIFKITVFTHSIGIPFKDYVKRPLNLGISIGAQYAYYKSKQNPLSQEFELSWFNHRHLSKSLLIKTNLSKNYFADNGFYIAPEIGIGYMLDISENASYKLGENGDYVKIVGGTHGFITQASISAGKRIKNEGKNDFAPFVKYEGMIQLPYSDFAPFLPHAMLHLGSKIFITENN